MKGIEEVQVRPYSPRIEGRHLSGSQDIQGELQREFKEGDQVRTSFDVQNQTTNVATSITKSQK